MPATAWRLGITYPQSIKKLGQFLTADNISAGTPNGGKDISGAIDMPATAWLLGIANPQSIKWLGHFLTADCKSAGTPNGGRAYPALGDA
jgi:predicted thioesterase